MKRFLAVLICVTGCATAGAAEQLAACLNSPAPLKYRAPVKDFSGELPIPDYLDTIEACQRTAPPWQPAAPSQPAPESAWLESERRLYQDVLARGPVDVLVVPFQVQGYGLDRIERALLTAELAYALGDASPYRIADPFLVARALGEGARRIDPMAVSLLAHKLGAKMIVPRRAFDPYTLSRDRFSSKLEAGVLGGAGPSDTQALLARGH